VRAVRVVAGVVGAIRMAIDPVPPGPIVSS